VEREAWGVTPVRAPEEARDGKPMRNAEAFDFRSALTRCTFPVLYPVLAPERNPDGKPTPNAET
jgi:hypothetical protein